MVLSINNNEIIIITNNIKEIYIKPNLKTLSDIYKYFNVSGEALTGNDVCATPFNQLAVSTNGNVYWHMRCYNDYKLGNINESGLYEIFHGYHATVFRSEFKKFQYLPSSFQIKI